MGTANIRLALLFENYPISQIYKIMQQKLKILNNMVFSLLKGFVLLHIFRFSFDTWLHFVNIFVNFVIVKLHIKKLKCRRIINFDLNLQLLIQIPSRIIRREHQRWFDLDVFSGIRMCNLKRPKIHL